MTPYIAHELRERVAQEAQYRCGYCLTQSAAMGMPMEIDHLYPQSLGGSSQAENLWLACPQCNRNKGVHIDGPDPMSGRRVPLFNPRIQRWRDHFVWQQNGLYIAGISPSGRATVALLRMNNEWLLHGRRVWILAGVHPPLD